MHSKLIKHIAQTGSANRIGVTLTIPIPTGMKVCLPLSPFNVYPVAANLQCLAMKGLCNITKEVYQKLQSFGLDSSRPLGICHERCVVHNCGHNTTRSTAVTLEIDTAGMGRAIIRVYVMQMT